MNKSAISCLAALIVVPLAALAQAPTDGTTSPPPAGQVVPVPPGGAAALGGPAESGVLKPSDFEGGKPEVPTFQRRGATRAGGPANELNTNDPRETQELPGGSVTKALSGTDLFHGNHCGKGTRGADLAPTDDLDASCLRHDQCYERAGHASCACDQQLRREALTVSTAARYSRELRSRALSVAQAAELMECKEP